MKTTKERKAERLAARFRRQYHSTKRIAWIRSLPCEVTGEYAGNSHWTAVVNGHTKGGGMGRKGPYTSIVPLLWQVHTDFDEMPEAFFEAKYGRTKQSVRDRAEHYARLWDEHQGDV